MGDERQTKNLKSDGAKVTMKWSDNAEDAIKQTMRKEINGYQIDTCFGAGGCPNRIMDGTTLLESMATILSKADLKGFLPKTINGPLKFEKKGYRVQLGGKLGRHLRLAQEFPGIFSEAEVIEILKKCLEFYQEKARGGKLFPEVLAENPSFNRVQFTIATGVKS